LEEKRKAPEDNKNHGYPSKQKGFSFLGEKKKKGKMPLWKKTHR